VKRAFVIGHPISHSRSPLIHGHWLDAYGIRGSYVPIDVAPEAMEAFLDRIRAGDFVGGNVTVPLKEIAFRLTDTHDVDTIHIGATNTLTTFPRADGSYLVHGTNTDLYGFLANLDAATPRWDAGVQSAIVLGAGGAARAVLAALAVRGIPAVHILNRTADKSAALAAELPGPLAGHGLDAFAGLAPDAGLVVNTTTIGMHGTAFAGLRLDLLPKHALVTDLVYVPLETPLLAEARGLGLRAVDGLGMLLHQAVPGFEAWFGVRPEVTPDLRAKVEATL
jgi:shikimate dehydrogenase